MKKIYILLISLFVISSAIAGTKRADRLYKNWEYFKAAELYKKEAEKNPSAEVYYKLGQCYRKMNSYKNLEQAAYDKVNAYGIYKDPIFYLHYGQVLKNNEKYDQAKIAFNKYSELAPNDPAGKYFAESIEIIKIDKATDEAIKVQNVAVLNSSSADYSPVKYKDGLVFASSRKTEGHSKIYSWTGANYLDLYYAKFTNDKINFEDVGVFGSDKNNKKYHDGPACFSKNFDTLYVSRVDKTLKGKMKKTLNVERNQIFISTLEDGKWLNSLPFQYNNDTFSVANPYLSVDGSKLYFVSDMPGGYGHTDIYYSNKEGNAWGRPINLGPNVNTFNREKFPMVDSMGNLYFASDGYQGYGGMDIIIAKNSNGYFEKGIPMKTPINSSDDDYGILFTQYNKAGYISSNREIGSKGDADIFYFDMNKDNLDRDLVASVYTIGYVKKITKVIPPVVAIVPVKPIEAKPEVFNPSPLLQHFIYFDFDKYALRDNAIEYLDSIVVYMKENPMSTIILTGHCDERGSDKYNMNLSNKRSKVTSQYLVSKGIKKERISAKGYGLTRMVNKCENGVICTEQEHQMNRRVEFYFE
jgi:tetratricopeptide (TPR) repeat protein